MKPTERRTRLTGALFVASGAIAFSGKAVIIKLAYRYGVDAVTLLALRMLLSAPFFALLGWWAARAAAPVSVRDRWLIAAMGFVGYYLASYFDFLGLQYVTAALERLLLFVHPTFVVLISAAFFGRRITAGRDVVRVAAHMRSASTISVCGDLPGVRERPLDAVRQRAARGVLGPAVGIVLRGLPRGQRPASWGAWDRCASLPTQGLVSCGAVVAHFCVTRDVSVIFAQAAPVYWLSLLMALVSTVLPIVLTSEGIRRMGASHASIIASIGPIATIALGAIFLGEAITAVQIAGALLVLAGTFSWCPK